MARELSEQQTTIITFEPAGHLLVRGETGSGKTTALVKRAAWLKTNSPESSILFVTLGAPLRGYTRRLLDQEGASGVDVVDFQSWAGGVAAEMGSDLRPKATRREARFCLGKALQQSSSVWGEHRFLAREEDFWFEEFERLFGQAITEREDYLQAGSTTVEKGEDRECVWTVFSTYLRLLNERNLSPGSNQAQPVLDLIEHNGQLPERLRYDHVLVDESQNFQPAWLRVIASLPRRSLTLASDPAQKTLETDYSWEEVGIALAPGRSKTLTGSYRTTSEIMKVARFLVRDELIKTDEDDVRPSLPERSGAKVGKITRERYQLHAWYDAIKHADRLQLEHPDDTYVIASPFEGSVKEMVKALTDLEVPNFVETDDDAVPRPGEVLVTSFGQLRGREFDHVILLSLEDRSYPDHCLLGGTSELTDSRANGLSRLLYTAMTRARKTCTLSGGVPFTRFLKKAPNHLFQAI